MKPIDFPEANDILKAPKGTEDKIQDLPIYRGNYSDGTPCVISVWELNDDDLIDININKKIYFEATGRTHPPIFIRPTSPFGDKI